eukprot:3705822-Alexandrium_andersonii.AAC.1
MPAVRAAFEYSPKRICCPGGSNSRQENPAPDPARLFFAILAIMSLMSRLGETKNTLPVTC